MMNILKRANTRHIFYLSLILTISLQIKKIACTIIHFFINLIVTIHSIVNIDHLSLYSANTQLIRVNHSETTVFSSFHWSHKI